MLAGVNDSNLLELARISGTRVVLRDDHLLISGSLEATEKAAPVAQHMVDLARMGVGCSANDISRFADTAGASEGSLSRLADGATRIFFSSRRRHTRFDCDWSSDVCSSD